MRRPLAFLLACTLVAAFVVAVPAYAWKQSEFSFSRVFTWWRQLGATYIPAARVLPSTGEGFPVMSSLCDAAPAAGITFQGQWACMHGDGGSMPGGVAFTLKGDAGFTFTRNVGACPNGTDCAPISMMTFTLPYAANGNEFAFDSALSFDAGDMAGTSFLACSVIRAADVTMPPRAILAKGTNLVPERQYALSENNQNVFLQVYQQDGGMCSAQKSSTIAGYWHLACGFYEVIGDGSSKITPYIDGVAGAAATTCGFMRTMTVPALLTIGRSFDGTHWHGDLRSTFVTALPGWTTAQASTAVATLAHLVLADAPTAGLRRDGFSLSWDGGMADNRTNRRGCLPPDGGFGRLLLANQACIFDHEFDENGAATELMLQANSPSNASWNKIGAGTALAPTVSAWDGGADLDFITPWSTYNGECVRFGATPGAADESSIYQNLATCVGAACSGTVTLIPCTPLDGGVQQSGTLDFCTGTLSDGGWSCQTCSYAPGVVSTCKLEGVTVAATGTWYVGNETAHNGGVARAAQDVMVSLANVTATTHAYAGIPSTTAATAIGSDYLTLDGFAFSNDAGCMRASVSRLKFNSATTFSGIAGWSTNTAFYFPSVTSVRIVDSTTNLTATIPTMEGAARRHFRAWWSTGVGMRAQEINADGSDAGASALSAFDGTIVGAPLYLGTVQTANWPLNGGLSNFEIDNVGSATEGCVQP